VSWVARRRRQEKGANMPTPVMPCPSCGSQATRPMTRKEWRERNAGRDSLVVVMPLICPACGRVWEARLSPGKCYLVAALSAVASLLCSAAFLASIGVLVWAVFIREDKANGNPIGRRLAPVIMVAGASAAGAIGTGIVCRKYIRRARER